MIRILLLLLLTGCVTGKPLAPVARENVDLRVVLYPDVKQLHAAYKAKGGVAKKRERAYGFAILQGDKCELHLLELRSEYGQVMEDWGHELSHCVYGDWHG